MLQPDLAGEAAAHDEPLWRSWRILRAKDLRCSMIWSTYDHHATAAPNRALFCCEQQQAPTEPLLGHPHSSLET